MLFNDKIDNQKTVRNAVQRAMDNGWVYNKYSMDDSYLNSDFIARMVFDPCCAEDRVNIKDLIFDHDFIKALWPADGHVYNASDHCKMCNADGEYDSTEYCWQYHLREMITAKYPVSYLEKHL